MDQLEELFKQMQELAGVGLDMLQGAKGAAGDKGGAPHGGAPAPHPGGQPPESEKQEGPPQPPGR
jgi:hypothetical protein